jgi:hypothetical protein
LLHVLNFKPFIECNVTLASACVSLPNSYPFLCSPTFRMTQQLYSHSFCHPILFDEIKTCKVLGCTTVWHLI